MGNSAALGLRTRGLCSARQRPRLDQPTQGGNRSAGGGRGGLPDDELRDRAAREIRGRAATLHRQRDWSSSIEIGMAQADHTQLQPLLEEIADLISPVTKGQAAKTRVPIARRKGSSEKHSLMAASRKLGRVDEFLPDGVFGIPRLNQA